MTPRVREFEVRGRDARAWGNLSGAAFDADEAAGGAAADDASVITVSVWLGKPGAVTVMHYDAVRQCGGWARAVGGVLRAPARTVAQEHNFYAQCEMRVPARIAAAA